MFLCNYLNSFKRSLKIDEITYEEEIVKLRDIQTDPHGLWVFDNDGTLYRETKPLRNAIEERMCSFISHFYSLDISEAQIKRIELLTKYDTDYTMVAMMHEGVDPEDFLRSTYLSVNPKDYGISANHSLRKTLSEISGEMIVLTNNPAPFAKLILKTLDILDLFTKVWGMAELVYTFKPALDSFAIIAEAVKQGRSTVYLDDKYENLQVAQRIGARTVLVHSPKRDGVQYYAESLQNGIVQYVQA